MACLTPYYIKNPRAHLPNQENHIPVPCNKCAECYNRRTSAWSFRMVEHAKHSTTCHFITFTYEEPPLSPNGFMTLQKKDWQDFVKRLRFLQHGSKKSNIQYYCAGEYGDTYQRPHYHAIIYNTTPELCERAWRAGGLRFGHTFTGTVTPASTGYCAKYINKGVWKPKHKRDDRNPQFSLMSKGLGSSYLSEQKVRFHQSDHSRNYITLDGGQKVSLPRYYRDKIFTDEQKQKQSYAIRADNDKREAEQLANHIRLYGNADGYSRNKHEAVRAAIDRFHLLSKKRIDV